LKSCLFVGEEIKIYENTDVKAYTAWIISEGFNYKLLPDRILITNRMNNKVTYDHDKFSKLLRRKLEYFDMSRADLAEELGIHEDNVFRWVIGRTMPSKSHMKEIMEILDISEGDLAKCKI